MSPRPYHRRAPAPSGARTQIVAAARDLLMREERFSMEAVARLAGVARMTVYYQFQSKAGLIAAVFDQLAADTLATRLPKAYARPIPLQALDGAIESFAMFWDSERAAIRRIHGLSALDPELDQARRARDDRRRAGLRSILARMPSMVGSPGRAVDDAVDLLAVLTSFETYDVLAAPGRSHSDVVRLLRNAARAVLAIPDPPAAEG
jgi:AcrR family transcriptional regulator